jgi:UPF0271 protein
MSVRGTAVAVEAQTLCVHGDTPWAAEIARRIRATLEAHDVTVAAFVAG